MVTSYQTKHQQFGTGPTQGYEILGRDYSEQERLSGSNLLPLQYRREINDSVNFFKCFKNICKINIFDYVLFSSCIKPLRNFDHLTLDVPFSK